MRATAVAERIVFRVADVQIAGRIREHLEHVVLRARIVVVRAVELVGLPTLLPLALDGTEIVALGHRTAIVHAGGGDRHYLSGQSLARERRSMTRILIVAAALGLAAFALWHPAPAPLAVTAQPSPRVMGHAATRQVRARFPGVRGRFRGRGFRRGSGGPARDSTGCATGDRAGDAIRLAGGPSAAADPWAVNLAARVHDGDEIYVPRTGEQAAPAASEARAAFARDAGAGARCGRKYRRRADARAAFRASAARSLRASSSCANATARTPRWTSFSTPRA